MPRGRPKRKTAQKLEEAMQFMDVEILAQKDQQIADLERKLRDFEERIERRMSQEPEQVTVQKALFVEEEKVKPKESIPIIKTITTRDMFEIEDRKEVYGTFRMQNKRPGERGVARIGALRKYKGDPLIPRYFVHGENYTVPKWMADWLNGGHGNQDDLVKSPRCNTISHNDQWNDLQQKRPLGEPNLHPMYSFTPVAKW